MLCLLANYVNNKNLFGYILGLSLILHVATDFSFFYITERRKKYEFQKRENPKANIPEPEPAVSTFI